MLLVIPRSAMCSCSLLSGSYFVAQSLCPSDLDNLKLQYPINAAVAIVFESALDDSRLFKNLSALYDEPYPVNAPALTLDLPTEEDVIISGEIKEIADLEKMAEIMLKEKHVYFDQHHKYTGKGGFASWFTTWDKIGMGVGFVLSVIGLIACIVACYNCARIYKVSGMMASALVNVPTIEALEPNVSIPNCTREGFAEFFAKVGLVVGCWVLYRVLRYGYRRWTVVKILLPDNIPNGDGNDCHIHLEIGNGKRMERLYLCSIPSNPLGLSFHGVIPYGALQLTHNRLFATLSVPWSSGTFKICCHEHAIPLPKVAYISIFRVSAIKNILRADYFVRAIMTHGSFSYEVPNVDMHKIVVAPISAYAGLE